MVYIETAPLWLGLWPDRIAARADRVDAAIFRKAVFLIPPGFEIRGMGLCSNGTPAVSEAPGL